MSNLDELKAAAEKADAVAKEAGQARQAAVDKYDTARVEAMDPKVVERARQIGVNPSNFEDTEHLQAGISTFEERHPELVEAVEGEEQTNEEEA